MRHCQNCNRNYSDNYFRKHCRTSKHIKKHSKLNIYTKKSIVVNEIADVLSNIINKHKRKYRSFLIVCKINNKKIMGYPKHVLLKNYDKDEMINVEFNFYSNREDMSFNHYISQPKSMLEILLIKNLDKYPEKLKILEYSKAPYHEDLELKYYGYAIMIDNGFLVFCIEDDWLNNTPSEINNDLTEILKNR